jgi:hypothetical protein
MARLNWDKGLTLVQRRAILKVSYGAVAFVLAFYCFHLYTDGTVTKYDLWLLALAFVLCVVTIILSLSGVLKLMFIDMPSNKIRNEDRS